jgi:tetratricopeptide (TPR) repeat protein
MNVLQTHGGIPPTDIAKVVADVHWRRHLALGEPEGKEDLERAFEFFSHVAEAYPRSIPAEVLAAMADAEITTANIDQKARFALAMFGQAEYADDELLTMAITLMKAVLHVTPVDYAGRPALVGSVCFAMRLRFERTGSKADLDDSIRTGTEALRLTPIGHPLRGGVLTNLGCVLLASFNHGGDDTVLDRAIAALHEALAVCDENPGRMMVQSNLGAAFLARFQHLGDASALKEAILLLRAALAQTGIDDPRLAVRSFNLANALRSEFLRSGNLALLQEAAQTGLQAVETVDIDNPWRGAYQASLNEILRLLADQVG